MRAIFNPVTILLATLCMQWVALTTVGDFSVKLPYAAMLLVILYVLTGPQKLVNALLAARRNVYWIVPLGLYLVLITLIQMGSPAASSGPRQLFYLIGCIALASALATTPRLTKILRYGAVAGFALLIISVEVLARGIGLSWLRALSEFSQGNLKFVVYSFFRETFNAIDPTGDPQGASIKNEVAVGVLVLGLLFRSATAKASRDIAGIACLVLVLVLLLLLNTRSVLVAGGLSFLIASIVDVARQRQRSAPDLVFKGLLAIALATIAVAGIFEMDAASQTLGQRFAFDDYSTAARLEQFSVALERVELNPLVGNGYFEVNGHVIHNLFLSAWLQGGLGAFILVALFYCGILFATINFIWRAIKRPGEWVLPIAPEWIAPLPITPLFRVWSSGDGGNMYLGEWVALGCFFGICLANELRRQTLARHSHLANWQVPVVPDLPPGWPVGVNR